MGDGGKGRGRTKVVFLLFYFIALTSLNMFACLVRPTCFFSLISFATSSRRRAGAEGRGGVYLMWHGGLSLGIDVSFGVIKITKISFAFLG